MSYMSGIMVGWALAKGLRRIAARGGVFPSRSVTGHGERAAENSRLGLLQGDFLETKFFRSVPAAFTLAHAIPGRRRYYAAALQGNEVLAAQMKERLLAEDGVDGVEINPVTGSLLLFYHGTEAALDRLMEEAAWSFVPPSATPLRFSGEEGLAAVGQNLRRMTGELNQRLKTATHGWLDLPSLFSFLFLIRGVQKMLLLKQFPSGPQLLWWAFSLLRGWRIA